MYSRVYYFITCKKLLIENHYGFQRGKSTEDALLELQTKILNA